MAITTTHQQDTAVRGGVLRRDGALGRARGGGDWLAVDGLGHGGLRAGQRRPGSASYVDIDERGALSRFGLARRAVAPWRSCAPRTALANYYPRLSRPRRAVPLIVLSGDRPRSCRAWVRPKPPTS
ncbi:MAG: hypothetical protein ACLUE1_07180 [Adlercreutzia equolifaciens]